MSFINHLIARAKAAERPCTLDVPAPKVGSLVEHILGCEGRAYGDRDAVRKTLIEGRFALHGCMLRVVGNVDTSRTDTTFPPRQPSTQGQDTIPSDLCPLSALSTGRNAA